MHLGVTRIQEVKIIDTVLFSVCVALSKEGVNWHKHSLVELESVIRYSKRLLYFILYHFQDGN